jgi:hypothetical protein
LRWSVYALVVVLFATGVAWWLLDGGPSAVRFYLIATHGFAAMAFLLALGAIVGVHVREGWRRQLNRASGSLVLAIAGGLILTAFGLYYLGSESLRGWSSTLHIVIGLALPFMLAAHVVLGRRARLRNEALMNEP